MDNKNRFDEIQDFLFDQELFNWVKSDGNCSSPFLTGYKNRYPGREKDIDEAVNMLLVLKVSPGDEIISSGQIIHSLASVQKRISEQRRKTFFRRRLVYITSSAAAVILLCFSFYSLGRYYQSEPAYSELFNSQVDPSENICIVVDQNKPIVVDEKSSGINVKSDGSIFVDNKKVSNSNSEGKIVDNQIFVPHGKRTNLILPDGTKLWINAGSKVLYRSDFQNKRNLYVDGEVYLDVTRDESHPLTVKTSRLEVKVLGTAFNVNDYNNGLISSVVLVRGSVDVMTQNHRKAHLSPNQKLDLMAGQLKVNEVDVFKYICWKDDIINFDGMPLPLILDALAKYYDVHIEGISDLEKVRCRGNLDLNKSIDEVLEYISYTTPLSFRHEGEKIVVSSK